MCAESVVYAPRKTLIKMWMEQKAECPDSVAGSDCGASRDIKRDILLTVMTPSVLH